MFLGSAFTLFKLINWKVKDEYTVKYSWPHPSNNGEIISVGGSFRGLKAQILFDEDYPEKSKITASIDARTVNTGNGPLNANREANEALETDKFPKITFASTIIKKTINGYEATGNLTIKGVTKQITFPFKFDTKDTPTSFPFFASQTFIGGFNIMPADFDIRAEGIPKTIRIDLTIPVTNQ